MSESSQSSEFLIAISSPSSSATNGLPTVLYSCNSEADCFDAGRDGRISRDKAFDLAHAR
jgi:hypothetical protein